MFKFLLPSIVLLLACGWSTTNSQSVDFSQKEIETKDWLVHLKTTGRISSNHFSDFVVDDEGNSYIASFKKMLDSKDRLVILKVDLQGKTVWELGEKSMGRATAVSIDQQQNIWVTGFFKNQLRLDHHQINTDAESAFLAQIDPGGKCLQLIKIAEETIAYDCHINSKGELLLMGNYSGQLTIQNISTTSKDEGSTFLAQFDLKGQCYWIESLNAGIGRIRSDSKGDFYLAGGFHGTLRFQKHDFQTESSWDSDGFLLKINRVGKYQWLQQFGRKEVSKYGYRTKETAGEFFIDHNNNIIVAVRKEQKNPEPENANINFSHQIATNELLIFDPDGQLQKTKSISKSASDSSPTGLTQTTSGNIWMTMNGQGKVEILGEDFYFEKPKSVIIHLNSDLQKKKIIIPEHGSNTIFRVGNTLNETVYFSGHFQSNLKIDALQITNDGQHGIFLYKTTDL